MPTITSRLSGTLEVIISVIGAALLIVQTISGADGIAQISAALVTLVAPICGAIRETRGANIVEKSDAIAGAISDALEDTSGSS